MKLSSNTIKENCYDDKFSHIYAKSIKICEKEKGYSFMRKNQYWLLELLSCLFAHSVEGITRSLSLCFYHF